MSKTKPVRYIVAYRSKRFRAATIPNGMTLEDAYKHLSKQIEHGHLHASAETMDDLLELIRVAEENPSLQAVRYCQVGHKPVSIPFFGTRLMDMGGYVTFEDEASTELGWVEFFAKNVAGVSAYQPQTPVPPSVKEMAIRMGLVVPAQVTPVVNVAELAVSIADILPAAAEQVTQMEVSGRDLDEKVFVPVVESVHVGPTYQLDPAEPATSPVVVPEIDVTVKSVDVSEDPVQAGVSEIQVDVTVAPTEVKPDHPDMRL